MKNNKKKFIIISLILLGISIIYTILVKYVDVKINRKSIDRLVAIWCDNIIALAHDNPNNIVNKD